MKKTQVKIQRILIVISILAGMFSGPAEKAYAAPNLTIEPITWNVIGLDSNNVDVGANNFPVGVRVCNTSPADDATNVTATFVWDDGNDIYTGHTYINLRSGSLSSITLPGILAANGACTDFYFEATVNRNSGAYDQSRRYHIDITSEELVTATSTQPRELFVEYLVSQSRNSTTNLELDGVGIPAGGSMALLVGNEYEIKLYGSTATNGYEQLETFINFPNTIFRILSVSTEYTADSVRVPSPNDKLYSDSCLWENDPTHPNYGSCWDVGKNGGDIVVTYQIRIIGGGGTSQTLTSLIYDFSGSSYHYNSDFSSSSRIAHIIDPTNVTISKSFVPDPTNVAGTSTLKFTIFNPNGAVLTDLNFTDVFPVTPGAMVTADPATYSTSGCGTATIEAPIGGGSFIAGAPSISASNISIAANGYCTVSVQVTPPLVGTYDNTSTNLFIGTVDTGNNASASLTADNTTYPPPACTPGTVLASWEFTSSLAPTYQSSRVSTAAASYGGTVTSTVPDTQSGQTGWSLTSISGSWPQNPSPPPGYPLYGAAPYFEFLIDTSNYSGVQAVFDVDLEGNWANSNDNHIYVWSNADGGSFGSTPVLDLTPIARNAGWYLSNTATATATGSSNTAFRINELGAKPTGTAPQGRCGQCLYHWMWSS